MHRRLLVNEMRDWYTKDLLMPLSAGAATAVALKLLAPTQEGGLLALAFLAVALVSVLLTSSLAAGFVRGELSARLRLVRARLS